MKSIYSRISLVIVFVFLSLILPVLVYGQDADTTPTLEVTVEPTPPPVVVEEPAPIVVDQVNFRLGIFGAIFGVIVLLLGGGGIGYVWGSIRTSKAHKDSLELAFKSTSPEAQEQIKQAHEQAQNAWNRVDAFAREVIKFIGEVTDSEPNEPTPVS
jgi:hypothetical protein